VAFRSLTKITKSQPLLWGTLKFADHRKLSSAPVAVPEPLLPNFVQFVNIDVYFGTVKGLKECSIQVGQAILQLRDLENLSLTVPFQSLQLGRQVIQFH
jgi:hypothetical protein